MSTLLLCDDSPVLLDVLSSCLRQYFTVLCANSGQECLDTVQSQSVDVILCDVMMPEIDGFETCRQLKAEDATKDIPVIFMTASEVGNKVQGFEAGGVDFVEKPGSDEEFAEVCARLHTHLTIRQQQKELKEKNKELQVALSRLKATQQQLITQEKLANLGELTAGVAHEIKNPLNFINNFLQVINEGANSLVEEFQNPEPDKEEIDYWGKKLPELAHKCLEHSNRAVRIVHGMLDHSKGGIGEHNPTNINVLCREYVNLAYHSMRAINEKFDASIVENYDPSLDTEEILCVPQDLSRCVLNLALNSFYSIQNVAKACINISTKNYKRWVKITLCDNGNGISNEILPHVFEPFFTTKPTGEGTGLGLSITHDIITKEHGGKIWCRSVEGQYAEFIIILPKKEGS